MITATGARWRPRRRGESCRNQGGAAPFCIPPWHSDTSRRLTDGFWRHNGKVLEHVGGGGEGGAFARVKKVD